MSTVFSHIIQKRLSRENEDVATEALAYVLASSEAARNGMVKLLRGVEPGLPQLWFRTQETEGTARPDMWGFSEGDVSPRVFVENKFWAGLTDNQPVKYLELLADHSQSGVLLFVVPAARKHTIWNELKRRLKQAEVEIHESDAAAGMAYMATTSLGPVLALTSWGNVLSALEHEVVEDPAARADLVQLRSLCVAADSDAFIPVSHAELSDQRLPGLMMQLGSIVQEVTDVALNEGFVSVDGLRAASSWDWIGRYLSIPRDNSAGAWMGLYFIMWKTHGVSPLWLYFSGTSWGRAPEVRTLIEPWAARHDRLVVNHGDGIAIALEVPAGEERAGVVASLINQLKDIAGVLEVLPTQGASDLTPPQAQDKP